MEYDIWFNLNDVLAYFTLLAAALPFWTMRFVARKEKGAVKTGIIANIIIATIATLIYIPLVPFITSSLGISQEYLILYFLVSVQIIELYTINALQSCLRATTPHAVGYGLLIAEVSRAVLGYILIIQFQRAIIGALLSFLVAYVLQIIFYLRLFREELKERIRWQYIKEWLKGSIGNIYQVMGNRIATFVFIMLFLYGGEGARGRYGLARQVATVITHSSFLAFALYPKLLAERRREDITTALKMVLMFAIPMTAGAIALSNSYVIIMKSEYGDSSPILVTLAIDALIRTISNFLSFILYGVERIDEKAKISLRELVKSRIFIVFSLPYFHSAIALPVIYFVLTNYAQNQPLQAAIFVSVINTIARLAMFFVLYIVIRRRVVIDIPWKNVGKYVLASLAMAIVLFIIPNPTRISLTVIFSAAGGLVYLGLLMTIDKEARSVIHTLWQEVKFKVSGILS
jgi:O-antigen/teichoic acid export membrane protein